MSFFSTGAMNTPLLPPYPHRQLHLLLGMFFGTETADTTVKKVIMSHIEEGGETAVVATGYVAEEEVFAVVVEDDLHGLGVVAVVGLALQAQWHPDTQPVPNKVCFVILAARQVAAQIEFAFLFHHFAVFNFMRQNYHPTAPKSGSMGFFF